MKYVLFAREDCPYCIKAKELLSTQEASFHIINFEEDQQWALEKVKQFCDWPTVPMIMQIKDQGERNFIGGYTDLLNHFKGE